MRGNGPYGDIAIDDIAFTNSKCSGGYIEMVSVVCMHPCEHNMHCIPCMHE